MDVTVFVLIAIPVWAFASGIAMDSLPGTTTPSEAEDMAAKVLLTLLWFIQIALMGLSTRLSFLAPLITVPATAFFYFVGMDWSEEGGRTFRFVPFFETFITVPVTPEENQSKRRYLRKLLIFGCGGYFLLIFGLALLRYGAWLPW